MTPYGLKGVISPSWPSVVNRKVIRMPHWMVYFDLSFRSMSIKDIVKEKGELWIEGGSSWLSINRGSYQVYRV